MFGVSLLRNILKETLYSKYMEDKKNKVINAQGKISNMIWKTHRNVHRKDFNLHKPFKLKVFSAANYPITE